LYIEEYFQHIQLAISSCPNVVTFTLDCDKRDSYEGFLRADITFIDESILRVREFVSVEYGIERDMYAYQYMDATNALIFRYDNTPHHQKLNLPTYPHHRHDSSEEIVIASSAPTLPMVLQEITSRIEDSRM